LKILIVKLSSLGDVVHAMPAVQDLRRALSQAQIDWVVEPAFAPLVRRCSGVQRVIECDLRRWRRAPLAAGTRSGWRAFRAELQAQAYDWVIDLQGLSKSALVAWLARLAPGGHRLALAGRSVGPHQFLGIEVNPRAATLAELVLWIGHLQWHMRTRGRTMPAEPVLQRHNTITCRDAVLARRARSRS
jgi:ADP-heptose:LPS heptosyltransferase